MMISLTRPRYFIPAGGEYRHLVLHAQLGKELGISEENIFVVENGQVIEFDEMFRGTLDGASVYPREVVKRAIQLDAKAVIFAHNHPSGVAEPSEADLALTRRLKDALALVEIRVLDHFVIGDGEAVSFAERGLL